MLKIQHALFFLIILLTASCQTATPPPDLTVTEGDEFTLTTGQIATLAASNLTVKLVGVSGDDRCPSEIECAVSGPVAFSLTAQKDSAEPATLNMQTFTDQDGHSPTMEFEGIHDRIEYEGYLIRVVSVLPYPRTREDKINADEYRLTLIVSKL